MIPLIVFYLHIVAIAGVYTRRWQEEGLAEGFLAVFFMSLIFFVGWSMASFIVKMVMPAGGLGQVFDNDATALTLLTCAEAVFYYFYFRRGSGETGGTATFG